MTYSITLNNVIALFGALIVLASLPSFSVLTVMTRTATYGLTHGIFTILGILIGDITFILIAIGGLSLMAQTMENVFLLIKYMGGAYIIFLGVNLCKSKSTQVEAEEVMVSSLLSSFLTGLSLTLADNKAILFYLGFFPAFVNISQISYIDIAIIIIITIVSVGGIKLVYALMADKARLFFTGKIRKKINVLAGSLMIVVGIFLLTKS